VIGAARAGALITKVGQGTVLRRSMAIAIALIALWLAWETRAA
jgi:hypothetical protein